MTLSYVRDGEPATVVVVTGSATADGATRPVIGVLPEEQYPLDVTINLEDVGGPSAGLMFALGILDKLGEESLTGGDHIAGTGEISPDGTVGPIGGITQKLIAAGRKDVDVFLVPEANCAEAVRSPPDGLVLASVGTLDDALAALEALRSGQTPVGCEA